MPKTDEEVDAMRAHYAEATAHMGAEEVIHAIRAISNCGAFIARARALITQRGWGQKSWSRGVLGKVHEAARVKPTHRSFSIPGALVAAIYEAEEADPNGAITLCCDILTHSLLQASIRAPGVDEQLGTPEQRWARAAEICQQPQGSLNAVGRWNDESCSSRAEAELLLDAGGTRAEAWLDALRGSAS